MATPTRIVVIGGVACGPKSAARARRLDPEAQITIIERGQILSYAGCGMPYCVSGDIEDCRQLNYTPVGVPRDAAFFRNVKDVVVLDRTLAQHIDRANKTVEVVHIETGEYRTIPYDKLVLATGGLPFIPPIEGIRLNRVFRMHQPEDAFAMRDYIRSGKPRRAVIIGGGLIGMEMTEALARNNLHVTLVEMLPHILPGLLDAESAAFLTKYVRSLGVDIRAGEQVAHIVGDDQGNVQKVVTAKGEELPADLVLVAVGVRPNTKLAQDAGLEVSKFGIVVNEHLQTSDPDIYAGGDCVANRHLITGDLVFVPMGSTANKHGRVIGDNLVGGQERFPGVLGTAVLKVFDYNVGKTGLTEQQARDAGYDVVTALAPSPDAAHYYPTHKLIFVKLIADGQTGRLLGIQALGAGETVKRVDVIATAIHFGATVEDLTRVDLGYAPPYSTAIDIAAHAANIIRNKMAGLARSISPLEVKVKLERGDEFVWLDVRSPAEYEELRIEDPRIKLIPLGLLRRRVDELPRDGEIIVFCKTSMRGYEAQRILDGAGFQNVRFMDGGIMAWPYEVVSGPASS